VIELNPPQEMPNIPTLPFENGCFGEPGDDLLAVALLDLAVLVRDQRALAVARASDVDARDRESMAREVRVEREAPAARLRLPVRQVLEQDRERPGAHVRVGKPDVRGELHAVAHRDAVLLEASRVEQRWEYEEEER
jgi:hypothetical protein